MGALIPFTFDGAPVRVVEIEGEPWFVGKDVCDRLGYADATTAIRSHCRGVQKLHPIPDALGRIQEVRVLAEGDVLRLIVKSTKPEAERFERWVFEEVLPSIRKTGGYATPRLLSPAEMLLQMAQLNVDLERRQREQAEALAVTDARVDRLEHAQTVLSHCPSNAEPITRIRPRIGALFGLSAKTIDIVMRQSPYAPKPAGMVRNDHVSAEGATYAVYWVKDVTATFERFAEECVPESLAMHTHPFVEGKFRLVRKSDRTV